MKFITIIFLAAFSTMSTAQSYTFSGVFHESQLQTQYWNNITWEAFTKKHKALTQQGYQMIDFEGQRTSKGKSGRFWGIWQKTNKRSRIKSIGGWENFKNCVPTKEQKAMRSTM